MYRYASQARMNITNIKLRERIITILMVLFLLSTIVLSITMLTSASFQNNTRIQLHQRMLNSASAAIDQVNRMESTTNSATSQRLGVVRQYIYNIEQLNAMSIALYGEGGRYAPAEAFTALYNDLSEYEALVQSAKNSTLDARSLLLSHLTSLRAFITGDFVAETAN